MTFLLGLHGTIATILFCSLLFIEEAGVPLFFAPGETVLIAAGVLIANGALSPWVFVPVACLSIMGGSLTAYSWARAIGSQGLAVVAKRLRAATALERLTTRLHSAGPVGISICRLLPGLRVYTSLVAGAIGIDIRVFVLGTSVPVVLWVLVFTLLGFAVGVPAEHLLGAVGKVALDGAILVVIGVASFLALRHVPVADRLQNGIVQAPRVERVVLALAIDGGIVASVAAGLAALARAGVGAVDADGFIDVIVIVLAAAISYVVISRRGPGLTGGEALLNVRYHHIPSRQ